MLHTRCILCAFLLHRRCICCIYCICWCIASAFLLHFCCIAGAFVAFFRISYYTSTSKLFGGNCNGIRSRLPVLSNSALKTRRQTSSQYGSENSIREREMKNVSVSGKHPKVSGCTSTGYFFAQKTQFWCTLVHTLHNTTLHNTRIPSSRFPAAGEPKTQAVCLRRKELAIILWYKMPVIPQWVSQKKSTFAAQQGRMSILLPIFAPSRFFIVSLQPKKK